MVSNTTLKRIAIAVALGALVALAGCSMDDTEEQGNELAEDSNQNISDTVGESYWFEIRATEANQNNLVRAQPPIQMDGSLERQNLIQRYEHLNDRENEHHVYLMSNDGKVISYFVAQGKVSSVNSKLTNDMQIVKDSRCMSTVHNDAEDGCFKTVESPQMDGSYGENGDGIFFFTTSGEYVETNLKYVVSEEPKNIQTQVSLVEKVGDDDSDTNSTDG